MKRIGIDLGGTKIEGVVLSGDNRILVRKRVPTPHNDSGEKTYLAIITAVNTLIEQLEIDTDAPCSVGIATPGTQSSLTGLMKNSNTICLNGRPLLKDLEHHLAREIRLANDANCFALSEAKDGAGTNYASVFGIIMGTGVGGGIVINNRLHTGSMGIGGEWGHNQLLKDGPVCYCGRKGCVETLISGPGLSADYKRSSGAGASPSEIIKLAEQGNSIAIETIERFLAHFGRAVATVINILDPHVIVLGGGLSNLDILYDRGRQAIEPHIFSDSFTTPILKNCHGDSSGVLGAAYLWD
ncbi:MAG TPA: ROK family protein [Gammaproteobacteria bacterium]|nr:fructokinase [bacterium BMS3Abin11]GMT40170.1 MAG: fructokinase [bacterium]HDH15023.1 ROK family protein [Gammaproteobacteria bacterium]